MNNVMFPRVLVQSLDTVHSVQWIELRHKVKPITLSYIMAPV